jgi:hypothetical protein
MYQNQAQIEKDISDLVFENLANAIVMQAVKDYRATLRTLKNKPHNKTAISTKAKVLQFFHSNWFEMLTDIDPKMLIKKLNELSER